MIFCRLDHARVHAECSFTPTEAGDSSACGQREVLGYTEQCGSMQGLSDLMYFCTEGHFRPCHTAPLPIILLDLDMVSTFSHLAQLI